MKRRSFAFLPISFSLLTTICLFSDIHAWAQGRNDQATVTLDFQTTPQDTQTTTVLDATPVIQDGTTAKQFTVTLVLQGAQDLIGFNTDLVFDPAVLRVASVGETRGDLNFDGRSNIADVLTLGERLNSSTTADGLSYFDLVPTGTSQNVIDQQDVGALLPFLSQPDLFWTRNPDANLTAIRESVEIYEDPAISNTNGRIDDLVVVLLPRNHPNGRFPAGFGFDGDARIAEITFEVINPAATTATIRFEDSMAIDEGTEITTTVINNSSQPQSAPITINLQ